jgi:hypothetical protein
MLKSPVTMSPGFLLPARRDARLDIAIEAC